MTARPMITALLPLPMPPWPSSSCMSADFINMRDPYESDSHRTTRPRTNGARATRDCRSAERSGSRYR